MGGADRGYVCGRKMRAERFSTIGTERLTNYALQIGSREEFWAGSLLGLSSRPVLIAASQEQLSEARTRLARVGINDARGYLVDGIEGWTNAGLPLAGLPQISGPILNHRLRNDRLQLLDVRRKPEWEAGHIEGAIWLSLDDFKDSAPEMNRMSPIAVLCKGGYRSLIACSLLQRVGFKNVTNVAGGWVAWEKAHLPIVTEPAIAV